MRAAVARAMAAATKSYRQQQLDAAEATVCLYVDLLEVARRHLPVSQPEVDRLERTLVEYRCDLDAMRRRYL